MEKVEELNVTVTYRVGLKDIKVPASVLNGLNKICDNMSGRIDYDQAQLTRDGEVQDVWEWMASNIRETDSWDLEYDIDLESL